MKLLKTKFGTALILAGLMFGFFSFSTTRIVAQDTSSSAVPVTEDDDKAGLTSLARMVSRYFVRGVVQALSGIPGAAVNEYSPEALD